MADLERVATHTWVDGAVPAINGAHLNDLEADLDAIFAYVLNLLRFDDVQFLTGPELLQAQRNLAAVAFVAGQAPDSGGDVDLDPRYLPPATTVFDSPVDRPSGVLKSLRFLGGYGNSLLADHGNAGSIYLDRLIATIAPGVWFNAGVGGYTASDMVSLMFGTRTAMIQGAARSVQTQAIQQATWPQKVFPGGILILDCVHNDSRRDTVITGGETTLQAQAKSRAAFVNHMTAAVRLARSQARIANTVAHANCATTSGAPDVTDLQIVASMRGMPVSGTGIPAASFVGTIATTAGVITGYKLSSSATSQVDVNATATTNPVTLTYAPARSGTWTVGSATTECTGGKVSSSTAAGATATYTINLPAAARVCWVTLAGDDDANGFVNAAATVTVDGGTPIAVVTRNQSKKSGTGPNYGSGQMTVDLGLLAAGAHSIVITHAGSAGQFLWDEALLVESPSPLTVVMLGSHQLGAAGYTAFGGDYATDQVYNGLLATVAALFPSDGSVLVYDPNEAGAGWNPATMLGPDATHPDPPGEQHKHDWLMSKFNALTDRIGLTRAQ